MTLSPDGRRLAFRHPLIGSTAVDPATPRSRRSTGHSPAYSTTSWNASLAPGQAAAGRDETVAGLLEEAARRRLRRGDALGAVSALTRAAGLSPGRPTRAAGSPRRPTSAPTPQGCRRTPRTCSRRPGWPTPPGQQSLHAAAASAFLLINGTATSIPPTGCWSGDRGGPTRLRRLRPGPRGSSALLVLLCWYGGDPALWRPLLAFMDRLTPEPPELLGLIIRTFADPAHTEPRGPARLRS